MTRHVHVFFLQGITYNQVVTVCPQLVGRVLYWQRSGGPVSFCCLAGEQVLDTRTFKVYSSSDDLVQVVAQGQGSVPMTSHCAKWAAKPIHFDLTGARPANRSSSGFSHLHRNLSHTKSMAFSK